MITDVERILLELEGSSAARVRAGLSPRDSRLLFDEVRRLQKENAELWQAQTDASIREAQRGGFTHEDVFALREVARYLDHYLRRDPELQGGIPEMITAQRDTAIGVADRIAALLPPAP